MLQQIDRRAWAMSRPNKPADLDEQSWEATVRDELAAIDPALITRRVHPLSLASRHRLDDLDLDLLADAAVVDADQRSTRVRRAVQHRSISAPAPFALSRAAG